ncbi:CDF family cation-efflux transporter FieF, partial [Escherichia coli]|nr:CDF family cation-efflux transporter FieF [Escherichia coli]
CIHLNLMIFTKIIRGFIRVEQAILRRFPGSDVIIHQDPCSVVPREGKRSMLS